MQQHSYNAAILAENKKSKHAKYKDNKREIINHENNADSNNKKNKNKKQENSKKTYNTYNTCIDN